MKKQAPAKKKAPEESLDEDDGKSVSKESPINFGTQRFCPKCGTIVKVDIKICNSCNVDLTKINTIEDTDDITKKLAITALKDISPSVRKETINSLGEIGDSKVLGILTYVLFNDPDEKVRKEAADELGDLHYEISIEALKKAMDDKSEIVRKEAVEGITKIKKKIMKRTKVEKKATRQAVKKPAPSRTSTKVAIKKPLPVRVKAKQKEISGSITVGERIKSNTPWLFGNKLRKPKLKFPKIKRRRISMPMPSKTLGLIVIFIILFVLQTGVIYLVYRTPPALGSRGEGEAMFLYPGIHDSFIIEGIVASILIFSCSIGYIFLYQASKYVYNRRIALRFLIFGLFLVFISFILIQFIMAMKAGQTQGWEQFIPNPYRL